MTAASLLALSKVAEDLGLAELDAVELLRTVAPKATVRTNDGRWFVTPAGLEELKAARSQQRRRPGHRRATTLDDHRRQHRRQHLRHAAQDAARRIGDARNQMASAAADRQRAILSLYDGGDSVRDIAAALGVSPGVVQAALAAARARWRALPDEGTSGTGAVCR